MRFVLRRLRPLGFVFLAALLAFGQQQAVLHLLGHSIERVAKADRADREGTPDEAPESLCAKCLALAHLDHVVDAPVHPIAVVTSVQRVVVATTIAPVDLAPTRVYESRAPPAIS